MFEQDVLFQAEDCPPGGIQQCTDDYLPGWTVQQSFSEGHEGIQRYLEAYLKFYNHRLNGYRENFLPFLQSLRSIKSLQAFEDSIHGWTNIYVLAMDQADEVFHIVCYHSEEERLDLSPRCVNDMSQRDDGSYQLTILIYMNYKLEAMIATFTSE
jgi:hypothetical protein